MNAKFVKAVEEVDYETLSSVELMEANMSCSSDAERLKIMRALRAVLRREEDVIKEKVKKEKEDSQGEKQALKDTTTAMMEARTAYLDSYREMNKLILGKSLIKHFHDFSEKVDTFADQSNLFFAALDAHKEQIKLLKAKQENG